MTTDVPSGAGVQETLLNQIHGYFCLFWSAFHNLIMHPAICSASSPKLSPMLLVSRMEAAKGEERLKLVRLINIAKSTCISTVNNPNLADWAVKLACIFAHKRVSTAELFVFTCVLQFNLWIDYHFKYNNKKWLFIVIGLASTWLWLSTFFAPRLTMTYVNRTFLVCVHNFVRHSNDQKSSLLCTKSRSSAES